MREYTNMLFSELVLSVPIKDLLDKSNNSRQKFLLGTNERFYEDCAILIENMHTSAKLLNVTDTSSLQSLKKDQNYGIS